MARPGIIAGITVLLGATLLAQEWSTYTNRVDRFEVNFPGQPKVEEITWPSEFDHGHRHTDAERIHAARKNHTEADPIKVGSTIGVPCHQPRDGSSGCLLGFITLEGAAEKMFD
jgi:hypothetical protein